MTRPIVPRYPIDKTRQFPAMHVNDGFRNFGAQGSVESHRYRWDLEEIADCATMLEAWLGVDPITRFQFEYQLGPGSIPYPQWLCLQCRGDYDTGVYSSPPTLLDVIDYVRITALGLQPYDWTFTLPTFKSMVAVRDELQKAIGFPLTWHGAGWDVAEEPDIAGDRGVITFSYYNGWDNPYYGYMGGPQNPYETKLWGSAPEYGITEYVAIICMFDANDSSWWGQCSKLIFLTDSYIPGTLGIPHWDDSIGVSCKLKWWLSADGLVVDYPYHRITSRDQFNGLVGSPIITEGGSDKFHLDVSSLLNPYSGQYVHIFLRIEDLPPWDDAIELLPFDTNWTVHMSYVGGWHEGYVWGMK